MRYAFRGRGEQRFCAVRPCKAAEKISRENSRSRQLQRETLMAKLNINGTTREVEAEADTPLLWVIREQVGLTGTKYGCGIAQCGACSVHINGEVRRSCSIRLGDVRDSDQIVTIEGLSASSSHPVQLAWAERPSMVTIWSLSLTSP